VIKRNLSTFGLFFATVTWGLSFFFVKRATAITGVWPFLFWRFALAPLLMILVFPRKFFCTNWKTVRHGSVLGGLLFLAIWTQTEGLQLTSVGRSGFITALYVPMTPILAWIFFKRVMTIKYLVVVTLATIGLYALTLQSDSSGDPISWWKQMNRGDAWTLATAFFTALHIIATEKIARLESDSLALGLWQFVACFVSVVVIMMINAPQSPYFYQPDFWQIWHWPAFVLGAVLFTAIVTTDFGFMMQIVCQKTIGALKAALIFALEAPIATLFAFFLLNEIMTTRELLGAALVLLASLVPERWLESKKGR